MAPPSETFPPLPRLPKELQVKIFKEACVLNRKCHWVDPSRFFYSPSDVRDYYTGRSRLDVRGLGEEGQADLAARHERHVNIRILTSSIFSDLLSGAAFHRCWNSETFPGIVVAFFHRIGSYTTFDTRRNLMATSVLARQIALESFKEEMQRVPVPETSKNQKALRKKLCQYLSMNIAKLLEERQHEKETVVMHEDVEELASSLADMKITVP